LLATPVSRAFDELAPRYDREWTDSAIGRLQRQAVWRLLDRVFAPAGQVLDLGCGTGVDAVYLARKGMTVQAIDVSPVMVAIARGRAEDEGLAGCLTAQVLSIEDLEFLQGSRNFDGVLSNFSPLNCVADLRPVAAQLCRLVRPGGKLVFCMMTRFCLWETFSYLWRGRLRKATRRWRETRNEARVGPGENFPVYYWPAREIVSAFAPGFRLVCTEGAGIFVPPSHMGPVMGRFTRLLGGLAYIDRIVARWPGLRSMGDHNLLVFERCS
jgi:ubiquinone/menaquinone biosynthesis C-methylase UbiE